MPQTPQQPTSATPQGSAADAASQAQEKAAEAAGLAQEKAQVAVSRVQDRLREQLDQRSSQAARQIGEQASDLRSVGEALHEEGKAGPAKAAEELARQAERVGEYLREKDSSGLLADAEDFGRRQPLAVAAGGLLVGFAASRFLKATSSQRYQERLNSPPQPNQPTRLVAPRNSLAGSTSEPLGSGAGVVA